jgi:Transglycosylase SLT domain
VTGSVGAYVAQVDRLLGAGEDLFPASGGPGGVDSGGGPSVPAAPPGSALGSGAGLAGDDYQGRWDGVSGLDDQTNDGAGEGSADGQRGRTGATGVRQSARTQAAAIAPATGSPAGVRLLVSTMDERLAAMQRQIDTTKAQNRVLALRLRQLAGMYRMAGAAAPMAMGPGGGTGSLGGLGGAGGGMPSFGGLAGAAPAGLRALSGLGGRPGAATTTAGARDSGSLGAAGIAEGRIALSELSFAGKGAWPSGPQAIRGYLEEALDRLGIRDPRARANWISGMMTIAEHESTYRTNAINLGADGRVQADGGPLGAPRGPWQVKPATFAAYHQPGTSNSIWDPVANAAASMNYQMGRYGVAADGHNERAVVGQANPGVHRGY